MQAGKPLIVGLGEVGGALATVLESAGPVLRQDLKPVELAEPVGVMHICIPFRVPEQFVCTVAGYAARFHPSLVIVHSTVVPGTTRQLAAATSVPVAYSPVRGKHVKMVEDLRHYTKFVAALTPAIGAAAARQLEAAGMKTSLMERPETLELAKLAETTYFGLQIAFAQELNRYASRVGAGYDDAIRFFAEVDFLPRKPYFPGFIGGHCVIPNIQLLEQIASSPLLHAILDSNELRGVELARNGSGTGKQAAESSGNR